VIAFPLHARMVVRSVLLATLGTWVVLTGFAALGALLDQVDDFGQGSYGIWQALLYVMYQLPRRAYESFPMAAVIGSVLALGGHAARSELVALRAAGLSPMRIGGTALVLVGLMCVPLMVATETVMPALEQRAQAMKLSAMQREVTLTTGANVWAREGEEVFQARGGQRRVVDGQTVLVFEDVRVYSFDGKGRLAWLQKAAEADYRPGRGWELRDVRRTVFHARSASVESYAVQQWETALQPGVIEAGLARPEHLPTAELAAQIEQLKRNGLNAGALEDTFWARWFFPLTTLALVFAALPVAFGQRRSGGFGARLFAGIVFALVARLLQPLLVNLAQAYALPVLLAYVLPVLLLGLVGVVLMRRAG